MRNMRCDLEQILEVGSYHLLLSLLHSLGISHQYYTKGNLVRICLGAVILLLLAGILVEDWYSQKKSLQHQVRAIHRPLPPLPLTQK